MKTEVCFKKHLVNCGHKRLTGKAGYELQEVEFLGDAYQTAFLLYFVKRVQTACTLLLAKHKLSLLEVKPFEKSLQNGRRRSSIKSIGKRNE
jgi:hypothetical protein